MNRGHRHTLVLARRPSLKRMEEGYAVVEPCPGAVEVLRVGVRSKI